MLTRLPLLEEGVSFFRGGVVPESLAIFTVLTVKGLVVATYPLADPRPVSLFCTHVSEM